MAATHTTEDILRLIMRLSTPDQLRILTELTKSLSIRSSSLLQESLNSLTNILLSQRNASQQSITSLKSRSRLGRPKRRTVITVQYSRKKSQKLRISATSDGIDTTDVSDSLLRDLFVLQPSTGAWEEMKKIGRELAANGPALITSEQALSEMRR